MYASRDASVQTEDPWNVLLQWRSTNVLPNALHRDLDKSLPSTCSSRALSTDTDQSDEHIRACTPATEHAIDMSAPLPHLDTKSSPNQSTSAHVRQPSTRESIVTFRQVQPVDIPKLMEENTKAQEELTRARNDALAVRLNLQIQRGRLRKEREGAGIAEGAFIRELRNWFLSQGQEFPDALNDLYTKVLAARESLGSAEEDYIGTEESYNMLEWMYTQKETRFFDRFDGGNISSASSYQSTAPEDQLDKPNLGYRPAHEINGLWTGELEQNQRRIDEDRQLQRNAKYLTISGETAIAETRRASFPEYPEKQSTLTRNTVAPSLPRSENDIANVRLPWAETKRNIDSWLFDTLQNSPLEKARFRRFFQRDDLDEESYWKLVAQHWRSDGIRTPPKEGRAGNQTASRESIDMPLSHNNHSDNKVALNGLNASPATPNVEIEATATHSTTSPKRTIGSIPHIIEPSNSDSPNTPLNHLETSGIAIRASELGFPPDNSSFKDPWISHPKRTGLSDVLALQLSCFESFDSKQLEQTRNEGHIQIPQSPFATASGCKGELLSPTDPPKTKKPRARSVGGMASILPPISSAGVDQDATRTSPRHIPTTRICLDTSSTLSIDTEPLSPYPRAHYRSRSCGDLKISVTSTAEADGMIF